jgi:uncharacterized protein (TIGR02421 family)
MPATDEHRREIDAAFAAVTAVVHDRLARNERVRRNLPGDGRLRVDRQLPFLCVYRAPPRGGDAGTRELVTTEAAYLFAPGSAAYETGVRRLVREVENTLGEHFGAFLLVEIWADDDRDAKLAPRDATRPGFRVIADDSDALQPTVDALVAGLCDVISQGWSADVTLAHDTAPSPPDLASLADATDDDRFHAIGIAVRPVYRDARTGSLYPVVLRSLRRQLAVAVRKSVFAFTGQSAADPQAHYESLGPSSLVKAARLVDQQLSEVSQSFDFVLQTVPLNSAVAWEEFQSSGCQQEPTFYYRPLPYDPAQLKRQLYEAPLDRIEDATLIHLFAETQNHLDRQLTALNNIDAPPFFYDSVQLYGLPDESLVQLAHDILRRIDAGDGASTPAVARQGDDDAPASLLHAAEVVAAARDQIDYYHQRLPAFAAKIDVRSDLASTMMVAHNRLLVSSSVALSREALEPILHHEIGTHLLTYFNGRQQPLQQMYAGLAGYEELQEGLAVLAEFLVGGLTAGRMRTLCCRVLAVRALVERRSFVEAFHMLRDEHRLPPRTAFMTALRAFRGGGLTKDAIYLRGLRDLADHLRQGHDLEPLYVGKIALGHLPMVQELRRRGIIGPPAVLPSFLGDAAAALRLDRLRQHTLLELVEHSP